MEAMDWAGSGADG